MNKEIREKIMDVIFTELTKKNKGQTVLFIIMSVLNVIISGVFYKLVEEVSLIKKQAELISHDEELTMYFSLLIGVSVMCILFSAWIMQIICKTVFDARKNVNIQFKLMGLSSKTLSSQYIKSFLKYQIIAVPIGIAFMELVYYVISGLLEIESRVISPVGVIVSICLHLIIVFINLILTFVKCAKFNPLEEMRDTKKIGVVRQLKKSDAIMFVIGVGLFVAGVVAGDSDNMVLKILPIVGIFLNLDLMIILFNKMMVIISNKIKALSVEISHRITLGNYKKLSPIISTLIVGVMVSLGLIGMFESIREISRRTVQQNIYFKELLVNSDVIEHRSQKEYEDIVNAIDSNAEISYGINLEMKDDQDIVNTIYAVDSTYGVYGEKMELADGADPSKQLDDENFDGIYLPDYFISNSKIGEKYELKLGNDTYEFTIAGRFKANGSRGRYGYVSKSYLQKKMGYDMVNALYIHSASDDLIKELENDSNVKDRYVVTKKDIENNSYENAINGVEIFEFSAFVIILISLIMFIHYAAANSMQNKQEIVRLKAMGVSEAVLRKTYNMQALSIFSIAFIIGGILAYGFINVGITMTLEFIDVPIEVKFPWLVMIITYIFLNLVGFFTMKISVESAYTDKINEYVTDN